VIYAVVTKTHPEDRAAALPGQVAMLAPERDERGDYVYRPIEGVEAVLGVRVQVFTLGEILLLDGPGGREVVGPGRKPSKWMVTTEEFASLDAAIARAQKVVDELGERSAG
jgi:hypothetical protein